MLLPEGRDPYPEEQVQVAARSLPSEQVQVDSRLPGEAEAEDSRLPREAEAEAEDSQRPASLVVADPVLVVDSRRPASLAEAVRVPVVRVPVRVPVVRVPDPAPVAGVLVRPQALAAVVHRGEDRQQCLVPGPALHAGLVGSRPLPEWVAWVPVPAEGERDRSPAVGSLAAVGLAAVGLAAVGLAAVGLAVGSLAAAGLAVGSPAAVGLAAVGLAVGSRRALVLEGIHHRPRVEGRTLVVGRHRQVEGRIPVVAQRRPAERYLVEVQKPVVAQHHAEAHLAGRPSGGRLPVEGRRTQAGALALQERVAHHRSYIVAFQECCPFRTART